MMRFIQMSKRLAGFGMALGSVALVAGCHSTKSSEQATLYTDPGVGATAYSAQSTPSTWAQTSTAPAQPAAGATGTSSSKLMQGEVSIPIYEEQIVVGTRQVESGGVRLRKQVTTETVNHPVQIRRETLVIDRENMPAGETSSAGATASTGTGAALGTPFEQGEVIIRTFTEEPVVEKRVVASGRITAQTQTNIEQTTVQREVRKEKIDVEKTGNAQNVTISDNVGQRPSDSVGGTATGSEQQKGSQKQSDPQKQDDPQKQSDTEKKQADDQKQTP